MKNNAISYLWKHMKPFKWYYMCMFQTTITSSILYPLLYNFALKMIIDNLNTENISYNDVLTPVIYFCLNEVILGISWRLSDFSMMRTHAFVLKSIYLEAYDFIQTRSYSFFLNNQSGTVSSKIRGLVYGFEDILRSVHHGLFSKILKIFACLIGIYIVNINLGLIITIGSSLIFITGLPFIKKLSYYGFEETKTRHRIVGTIFDKILNVFTIRSYAREKFEKDSLNTFIDKNFVPKQKGFFKYNFILQSVMEFAYIILIFIMIIYTVKLKINNLVTLGAIALLFDLSLTIAENLWEVMTNIYQFVRDYSNFKSSLSLFDHIESDSDTFISKHKFLDDNSIEFENVSFHYDSAKPILNNLSFKIESGSKVGIVGYSGSGKSTIVKLIMKYFDINEGKILIGNKDFNDLNKKTIRKAISLIPQSSTMFNRTVAENVSYGREDATQEDMESACRIAYIDDFVNSLPDKYKTIISESGGNLSGGQRQRLEIARAVLKDAPIIILDEATSSLDSNTELSIQKSLEQIFKDKNKTVLAIAHRLSTLKNMDEIIVLDKGKVIERGPHNELINQKDSFYSRLWDSQQMLS